MIATRTYTVAVIQQKIPACHPCLYRAHTVEEATSRRLVSETSRFPEAGSW